MENNQFAQVAGIFLRAACSDPQITGKFSYKQSSGSSLLDEIQTDGQFDARKAEDLQVIFVQPDLAPVFEGPFEDAGVPWIETTLVVRTTEKTDTSPAKGHRITAFFFAPESQAAIQKSIANAAIKQSTGEIPAENMKTTSKTMNKPIGATGHVTDTELQYIRDHAKFDYTVIREDDGWKVCSYYADINSLLKLRKEAMFIWGGKEVVASDDESKLQDIMREVVDTSKSILAMNSSGNGEYSYITSDGASVRVYLDDTVEFSFIPRSADGFDQKVYDVISEYYKPDFCDARDYEQTGELPDIIRGGQLNIEKVQEKAVTNDDRIMMELAQIFYEGAERLKYVKKKLEDAQKMMEPPETVILGESYKKMPSRMIPEVLRSINSLYNRSVIADNTAPSVSREQFMTKYLGLNFLKSKDYAAVMERINTALDKTQFSQLSKADEEALRKRIIEGEYLMMRGDTNLLIKNVDLEREVARQQERETERGREVE